MINRKRIADVGLLVALVAVLVKWTLPGIAVMGEDGFLFGKSLVITGGATLALCLVWLAGRHSRAELSAQLRKSLRERPRLFSLAIAATVLALGFAFLEAVFLFVNRSRESIAYETTVSAPYHIHPDPGLGHRLVPGARVVLKRLRLRDGQESTSHQTIDASGLRVTTRVAGAQEERYAAFFGGSFTYGEWLEDDETIASRFSEFSPRFRSVNYGCGGYGANHVLAQLQAVDEEFLPPAEKPPVAIYTFIDHHIRRVIGSKRVTNEFWGSHAPYYSLTADGTVTREGSFYYDRPWTSLVYRMLHKSQLLRFFNWQWPPTGLPGHYDLHAGIVNASRLRFEALTGSEHFYVVIYPGSRTTEELTTRFAALGIRYLDYSKMWGPDDPEMFIEGDGHPTAAANLRLGKRLAEDLEKLVN